MAKQRKYLRLIFGSIILIVGIGFMLVPFLPIGYIFIFVAVFLLSPYIPFLAKLMRYLKSKDKNGELNKVERKIKEIEDRILYFLNPNTPRKKDPDQGGGHQ